MPELSTNRVKSWNAGKLATHFLALALASSLPATVHGAEAVVRFEADRYGSALSNQVDASGAGSWDAVHTGLISFPYCQRGSHCAASPRPVCCVEGMVLGAHSVSSVRCVLCVLSFGAIPLAVLTWALRGGAPTRLERCGAIAGIVAGATGAAAYAFNCASDSVPFIAFWYGAAVASCAFIGTQPGPRFLRW